MIWVFFYGTFMNRTVLSDYRVVPTEVVPGKLNGFRLHIRPRANLIHDEQSVVYGAAAAVTHTDLERLYSDLQQKFGLKYLPEPVLFESMDGNLRPALCYTMPETQDAPPDPAYVNQLAACIRELKLPEWYAKFVESFR